jgi:hypothetical protein|tara:strand:+ start:1028 stop:1846 length:819 start_codon:yes stop_codon:yes gene_type:complete
MAIIVSGITTISVDTVYQRVLALANKEQRGYITPQEFNLMANQAQHDIFEQYFYDLASYVNLTKTGDPTNTTSQNTTIEPDFSSMVNLLREKLTIYEGTPVSLVNSSGNLSTPALASTIYRTGRYFYTGGGSARIPLIKTEWDTRPLIKERWDATTGSNWHNLHIHPARYFYHENTDGTISAYAESTATTPLTSGVSCEVIAAPPRDVKWAYVVVNEKALYDATNSVDFNLHRSEESKLVIKILELAGIIINKPGLVQVASNEEAQNVNEQK